MATLVRCLTGIRTLTVGCQLSSRLNSASKPFSSVKISTPTRGFRSRTHLLSSTQSKGSDNDQGEVTLTESCIKQLKTITVDDSSALRVSVEGGGCSGFQYKFELDDKVDEDDRVFGETGARVVIDPDTMEFMHGATIDYHQEMIRSAFVVLDNPRAEHGCSCGSSFSVKL